ncbi:MAG: DUF4390 domain-containing protein [bacterium]
MRKGLLIALFWASIALASPLVISKPTVFLKDTFLATSFKIQHLLGQQETKTIQSGFTVTIKIDVELWKKGRLFHDLETTRQITKEISYDIWEKIYTLRFDKGDILKFDNLTDLKETLSQEDIVLIRPLKELEGKKVYFVQIRVDMESINKKEMEEIAKRINGDSPAFINLQKIFAVLVRHRSKDIKSYIQSDNFKPDTLKGISND